MFAILLKDILSLKTTILIYTLFLVTYTFVGIDDKVFLIGLSMVFCMMLPVNALYVEERCHWERMAVCMPISRGTVVISKYMLSLVGILLMWLPVLAVQGLYIRDVSVSIFLGQDILLILIQGIFITAIQMPFLIIMGVEKGRFVSIVIILSLCLGLPILFSKMNFISNDTEQFLVNIYDKIANNLQTGVWTLGVVAVTLLALSIWISVKAYQKKEII